MSRRLIKPVTMKDFRGILVDVRSWNDKKLYRVFEPFDETTKEILFYNTIKDGKNYIDADELIGEEGEIETNFRDADTNPELYDLPEDIANGVKKEQIANFLWLSSVAKERIPIGRIIKLIKAIPIKYYHLSDASTEDFSMIGYYDSEEHFIAFNVNELTTNNKEARSSRFHEFIHYIQDMLLIGKENKLDDIITEAQTESLAIERTSPKKARAVLYTKTRKPSLAVFNCSVDCYKYAVCLLRQMEAIMGRRSYDKDFASTREFPHEFIQRYGKELYTYVTIRMNALEYEKDDDLIKNRLYYLSETQDKLMKEAFRQDISRMHTLQDAKDILTRLRALELQRAEIHVRESSGEAKQLGDFAQYYDRTYKRIGHKLLKLGYSQEEIIQELESLKYEKQQFYPVISEEAFVSRLRKNIEKTMLNDFQAEQGIFFDPKKQKIVYKLNNNGDSLVGIVDRRTSRILFLKGFTSEITRFTKTNTEKPFKDEEIRDLERNDTPELILPSILQKKYLRLSRNNSFIDGK